MAITPLAPHPFTLRQLQYVVAVADERSFRRAAQRCAVSQPSLSAQLAQVEEAVGMRLFERDRRHVLVTPAGVELVARARRLLVEADDLVLAARRAADPLAGMLRIGVIPTVSPYLVPRLAPALRAAHPRLAVRWVEDKTRVLVRALDAGELDAALLALEAPLGDVDHETVCIDPFVLATRMDDPLGRSKSPARPEELREANVLLLDDGHCLRDQALAVCARAGVRELAFRATSLPTLVAMVAGGAGVTLLPRLAVEAETRHAELRVRPFAAPAPSRTLALAWRRRSPLAPALRTLAGTMREACPKTDNASLGVGDPSPPRSGDAARKGRRRKESERESR
jgi:LysR family hydrogen peroxide-inducible transcriptional activator